MNRTTSQVTAALTNGRVGASFSIYPDGYLTFVCAVHGAPVTGLLPLGRGARPAEAAPPVYGPTGS